MMCHLTDVTPSQHDHGTTERGLLHMPCRSTSFIKQAPTQAQPSQFSYAPRQKFAADQALNPLFISCCRVQQLQWRQ